MVRKKILMDGERRFFSIVPKIRIEAPHFNTGNPVSQAGFLT
jgi:hypothetical protein